MLIRRPGYAIAAAIVFVSEVAIAFWAHDRWIRPYGGDVLAVVLVYFVLRAITPLRVGSAALLAFVIGCCVEVTQWFDLVGRLGLGADSVGGIVLGTSFAWWDLIAYGIGAIIVLMGERVRQ